MWWPDTPAARYRGMARLLTRCRWPASPPAASSRSMAPSRVGGRTGIGDKLSTVEVAPIAAPNGTRLARVGVSVRNELMYQLTGGGARRTTNYRLDVRLSSTNLSVIVDVNTGRPDIQNYGIDATYTLTDVTNGKTVVTSTTFSRVSYNIPGQQQRFAGDRGLRDAEDRAAKVIAENIRSRLASYFTAGT